MRGVYNICLTLAESGILFSLTSTLNLITAVLDTQPKYDLLRFIFDAIVRHTHHRDSQTQLMLSGRIFQRLASRLTLF